MHSQRRFMPSFTLRRSGKLYLLLFILVLLPSAASAQYPAREVESKIERVTVFSQGAQVTRAAETTVPAGNTVLLFTGITAQLDPESIQLKADGALTVLSVVHRNNYFEDTGQTEAVRLLHARRVVKQDSVKAETVMLEVYQQEEEMLVTNKAIGGSQTGVQVAELISATDFFRARLTDIKAHQLALTTRINGLQADIAAIDRQLNEISASRQHRHTSEVAVTVLAEAQTTGAFELTYLTPEAGWYPHYDIRVRDVQNPIALIYKANVQQRSDEAWEDVKLTLSTGNPAQSGSRPTLWPWRLGFYQPRIPARRRHTVQSQAIPGMRVNNPRFVEGRVLDVESGEPLPGANLHLVGTTTGASTDVNGFYRFDVPPGGGRLRAAFIGFQSIETPLISNRIDFILAPDFVSIDEVVVTGVASGNRRAEVAQAAGAGEPASLPVPVQPTVNTTTVEFEIELPYTIPPDGKPNAVQIEEHEVPATYRYYCSPKLDRDAFLTARITDWEDYYLLNGDVNLFFEGTFVGKSYLDVQNVSDTLVVSLGRDKGIVVERTRRKAFTRRQVLGSKQTESRAYQIEVRNTKRVPIYIVVDDQVPLSTDKRIEVDSELDAEADYNEQTGLLRWRLDLPPASTETLGFRYAVKYPKGSRVLLN